MNNKMILFTASDGNLLHAAETLCCVVYDVAWLCIEVKMYWHMGCH